MARLKKPYNEPLPTFGTLNCYDIKINALRYQQKTVESEIFIVPTASAWECVLRYFGIKWKQSTKLIITNIQCLCLL